VVPIKAVTFDAAGTLITPYPSVGDVYAEIATQYGLDADAAQLNAAFPQAFQQVRARWAVLFGANDHDARKFWHAVIDDTFGFSLPYEIACDLYDTFATGKRWRVLPQVRETLQAIAALPLPMAVVSNFDGRLPLVLADLQLGPFTCVVTSAAVGQPKPEPAGLLFAANHMQVNARDILHVGDSAREDGELCQRVGATYVACDEQGLPREKILSLLAGAA
jgi:putative hydrolase of the HAD superfamily